MGTVANCPCAAHLQQYFHEGFRKAQCPNFHTPRDVRFAGRTPEPGLGAPKVLSRDGSMGLPTLQKHKANPNGYPHTTGYAKEPAHPAGRASRVQIIGPVDFGARRSLNLVLRIPECSVPTLLLSMHVYSSRLSMARAIH